MTTLAEQKSCDFLLIHENNISRQKALMMYKLIAQYSMFYIINMFFITRAQ